MKCIVSGGRLCCYETVVALSIATPFPGSTGLQVSTVFPFDKSPIVGFTVPDAPAGSVAWRILELDSVLTTDDPTFYGVIFTLSEYDPNTAFLPINVSGSFVATNPASPLLQMSISNGSGLVV